MDDWKEVSLKQNFEQPVYRTGWPGVWDALRRAVSGRDHNWETIEVELKFFMKPSSTVDMSALTLLVKRKN